MLEVTVLASGSAGNAALVRTGGTAFLVDAGLSAKQLCLRLQACGQDPACLAGVLLTHEHSDHCSALKTLLAKHDLPIYCNQPTGRALQESGLTHKNWRYFQNGSEFTLGDTTIRPFSVPHDAADPVGFRISSQAGCFGVLTDLGYAAKNVFETLSGIRALLIETNHDEQLLHKDTKRPWSVKQRILSRHGHLSNAAASQVVVDLNASLEWILLGHLSRDCNSPELAVDCVTRTIGATGRFPATRIHCAGQDAPSPAFQLI